MRYRSSFDNWSITESIASVRRFWSMNAIFAVQSHRNGFPFVS